jgi:CheY-like chemotaxis protein
MMSGSISVESEYGRGSVFTMNVRQRLAGAETLGRETAESLKQFQYKKQDQHKNLERRPIPQARVLVVDDTITNLVVAKGMMSPYGITVDCMTSGKKAIEALRNGKQRYDAVFMDHMMPEMDGMEAVRIIRNEIDSDYARTIPIIALTANAMAGTDRMFLENGFQAFLSKPLDAFALDGILDEWVRGPARDAAAPEEPPEAAGDPSGHGASDPLRSLEPAGISVEAALRRLGGNREAYIEILRAFVLDAPAQIDRVRSCTAESLGEYVIAVHGLKGINYGICADAAGDAAAGLEAAARAGRLEAVLEGNPPFIEAMEKLSAAVKAAVDSLRPRAEDGPKPRRSGPDGALLEELLDACKGYDLKTMEKLLSDLEKYAYESGGDLIRGLREDMDNLEYDSIRERLEGRGGRPEHPH